MQSKTIIIGAGFSGMAAGIKTGATIYEKTDHAGGICTDYVKDGFRFSNGGPHYLFGKDKGLEYIKSLVEVKEYERKAGVYYNHIFPYPFQSTASKDLEEFKGDWSPQYFDGWLVSNFGKEQCNLFFHPFNEKYTAGLMSSVLPQDNYKTPKTGTGWVSTFCDPVNGLDDLVEKMASKCDIQYNKKATKIHTDDREVEFEDGTSEEYGRLISTIPLNKCMELCGQESNLPYTSVLVINVGAESNVNFPKEHWLYIPFCKSGFHRVSFYTNVDESKAPPNRVGLSVEIAYHNTKIKGIETNLIAREVCQELMDWGWIKKPETICIDWVECAYTWQYNKEDVSKEIQWLKERDITSTGRYGKWEFCGVTQSIMMGFDV